MCKEIGGYFSLELNNGKPYHKDAIELNTARNAFEYILRANKYQKVYLPYYTCEVMLEPINKLGIEYEFYSITKEFYPIFDKKLKKNECLVYTNYWGLNQHNVKLLSKQLGSNLIVDNSQAFYAQPIEGIDTFYSARKFFGVADGAYLYCNKKLDIEIEQDISWHRMSHLLKRIDLSAQEGYEDFKKNDDSLENKPIMAMSKLTNSILQSIDYNSIARIRRENYKYIQSELGNINELKLNLDSESVPMVYPFLIQSIQLKEELIRNKIFIATYWPMVKAIAPKDSDEYYFYQYLLPLPVDQRNNIMEMQKLLFFITNYINN